MSHLNRFTRLPGIYGQFDRFHARRNDQNRSALIAKVPKKLTQDKHLNSIISVNEVELVESPNYDIAEMVSLNDRLNTTKSKLDEYYEKSKGDPAYAKKWLQIQSSVDLYKNMRVFVAREFNAQIVTNAWLKYYEIYSHYKMLQTIPQTAQKPIRAFFNAELPGAALCAFNHYMTTVINQPYEWFASSLIPHHIYETMQHKHSLGSSGGLRQESSDKFDAKSFAATTGTALGDVYGIFAANPNNWLMNSTNNGDATVVKNLLDWEERIGGTIDIYSHDAGIDVSADFNQQELANAKLHLGCALAGFMTLAPAGIFIAKQYTFFTAFTYNLILIYASMFEKFYICKPLTSRPFNSEIYLIGTGFNGMPNNIRDALLNRLENFNTNPFLSLNTITNDMGSLIAFANVVYEQQIKFIEENIRLANDFISQPFVLMNAFDKLRVECRDKWLAMYPVYKINSSDYIPSTK